MVALVAGIDRNEEGGTETETDSLQAETAVRYSWKSSLLLL